MKIKQITETTTAGAIATVNSPLGGTQSRGNPSIYGGKKVGTLFKGKKTSAPYANSINESAELSEAHLEEDDVIVVPGQGRKSKTGFVPHGQSRIDHEVEMARSDLFSAAKNAQQVFSMIKDVSEDEGLDGWVQEKIIKANDYLNTIREYLEGKQVQGVDEADMSRRGFLKGLGAVALGAVAGNALAGTSDPGYVKKVQEKHFEMAERNPKYAKEHQALGLLFSRGITGNAAETNKQWAIKTAELLQKYGVTVNEGVTENNQRVDSLVTDALKIMRGSDYQMDPVRAIKTVLGEREYNSRRGFYNFYVKQLRDMYDQEGLAEGSNPEKVEVRFSAKEYAAMSPAQKAAKQEEWQQLKQQAKMRLQNFTLIDTDKEQGVAEGASSIEQKIIKLYKQGLSDDEIASRLKIDSDDVKSVLDDYEWVADTTGKEKGVAEGSRNAYLKHNNLVDIEKPLAGLKSEFEKFLQTHDPEEKQKYQQGIKQRIKTRTMAGPKGQLPEQGISEGAKVDRMVKHVAQSEKKLGKSKDEAENIAWATANKRGMLNNKNKKA